MAGALAADVDATEAGHFLRKVMRGFAGVVAVGAGAVHFPVEAGGEGFLAENAFGHGAAADVAQTNEENFHGARRYEIGWVESVRGEVTGWDWWVRAVGWEVMGRFLGRVVGEVYWVERVTGMLEKWPSVMLTVKDGLYNCMEKVPLATPPEKVTIRKSI